MHEEPPQRTAGPSRKGKERQAPQPTDIAEKLVALQRRQAHTTRPKEKAERAPPTSPAPRSATTRAPSPRRMLAPPIPNPNIVVSHPALDPGPDEHDFSRRLKLSPSSPRSSHARTPNLNGGGVVAINGSSGKLYNPNTDPIRRPIMTAEPDSMSDGASSSYAPRGPPSSAARAHHQQSPPVRSAADAHRLFDPRKDNPHKFAVLSRPHHSPGPSPGTNGRPAPTPKSSGDYVSASSTSSASYAQSTISSNFTLSSATDSSASSAIFDSNARRSEESANQSSALSLQLKKLYRTISSLESRVSGEDRDRDRDDDGDRDGAITGVLIKGRAANGTPAQEVKGGDEEAEKEKWQRMVKDHQELAETVHTMLALTLQPSVPASLRNIPAKYNFTVRLWTNAFHRLLETLRRAAMPPTSSAVALEYLQNFIYYAYTFYTVLLEERNLSSFRGGWLEALGDLARYRMAVSAMLEANVASSSTLTTSAVARATQSATTSPSAAPLISAHLLPHTTPNTSALSDKAASPTPAARIDDTPPPSRYPPDPRHAYQAPSVGIAAARMMELEPEKERWRQIAKEWYARGLASTPGAGKLHHHLGLLSRDKEGGEEELRGVYHFVKSMITVHPFTTSRESVLPLWSPQAQTRRQAPDARLTELFVLLHGMLFTNIQLDDFKGVLERFEEKLLIEDGEVIEEREWIMMAVINIGAILEYGRPGAVLRRVAGIGGRDPMSGVPSTSPAMGNGAGKVKLMTAKRGEADEKKMDVDDDDGAEGLNGHRTSSAIHNSPALSETATPTSSEPELPMPLKLAMQLTFSMLAHTLRHPTRQSTPFARQTLNPYIVIVFTFLATVIKDRHALSVLERAVPWEALAAFLNTLPRRLVPYEQQRGSGEGGLLLTSGSVPLSEDWCLRGLGWGGKKVYERGFWGKDAASGEEKNVEVEVLDKGEGNEEMMDGIIEDDNDDENEKQRSDVASQEMRGRWVRVARGALKIAKVVNGLAYTPPAAKDGRGEWRVEGALADKVARWREEERREREEEERRLRGTRWGDDDSMDVDEEENMEVEDVDSEDNEDGVEESDEVKALRARRKYLQSLLQSSQRGAESLSRRRRPRGRISREPETARKQLCVVSGYTILVVDTNILLSSLSMFSSLVESLQWTVVIPLPVIMELDGLSSNPSPLGEAASAAATYINTHLRTHSTSLKVQTSRGNYLTTLSFRTEQVDFGSDKASWERNMDDLILRAAIWQTEHWVDRSAFLKAKDTARDTAGASKVVLLSFDRMLRLKARSRDVDAANEPDLAAILAAGT